MITNEIKYELDKIKKCKGKIKWRDLKYETKISIYNFQQCEIIRSFSGSINTQQAKRIEAEGDQNSLLNNIIEFDNNF